MIYAAIVASKIRQTFVDVNNQQWDKATAALHRNVYHRVSGDHALAGERHDKASARKWFERLGRVYPNLKITVTDITVTGWPWRTSVFAVWNGDATLLDGRPYVNRGMHVFDLRWGRVHALEEFQDSQSAAQGLARQAASGIEEAGSAPILS